MKTMGLEEWMDYNTLKVIRNIGEPVVSRFLHMNAYLNIDTFTKTHTEAYTRARARTHTHTHTYTQIKIEIRIGFLTEMHDKHVVVSCLPFYCHMSLRNGV
jgi:hypothetical protein